jgi:hypothetical protein
MTVEDIVPDIISIPATAAVVIRCIECICSSTIIRNVIGTDIPSEIDLLFWKFKLGLIMKELLESICIQTHVKSMIKIPDWLKS